MTLSKLIGFLFNLQYMCCYGYDVCFLNLMAAALVSYFMELIPVLHFLAKCIICLVSFERLSHIALLSRSPDLCKKKTWFSLVLLSVCNCDAQKIFFFF